jgi:lysophospholipase L1-like esterase
MSKNVSFSFAVLPLVVALSACNGSSENVENNPTNNVTSNVTNTVVDSTLISPSNPNIVYQGRWLFDNPDAPQIGWQGSTIEFQFSGESVSLDIDVGSSADFFRVILDGEPTGEAFQVTPGRKTIKLLEGLSADNTYSVKLMKETFYGDYSTFYGLTIEQGNITQAPVLPELKLAFFGDSNMDGSSLYSEKDSGDSGSYYAYPAMVSRMLNSQIRLQALGGATLTENGTNNVLNFVTSLDKNENTEPFVSDYQPTAIIVNAGANDIYKISEQPLEPAIKQRYRDVVSELRKVYGAQPHIVLYNAYGWNVNEPANYSKDMVADLNDANLSVLHYPWIWEQWHGSMIEHGGQARLIAQHLLDQDLGFTQIADADVFNGFGVDGNVANGSFEHKAPGEYSAFGWRYAEDGVERIASDEAQDGNYFIRLAEGIEVHQGTDATGDFSTGAAPEAIQYQLTAYIKSSNGDGQVTFFADFEEQDLYKRENRQQQTFNATNQWQQVMVNFTAPAGTWKTYFGIKGYAGTVDIDNLEVQIQK